MKITVNRLCLRRMRHQRAKGLVRLARQRAFNDMIERLCGHRGGKTFMVDTAGLKSEPPRLRVTERYSLMKLSYTYCVAGICTYHGRKYEIIWDEKNNTLVYLIY